jgi:hypothetical protein
MRCLGVNDEETIITSLKSSNTSVVHQAVADVHDALVASASAGDVDDVEVSTHHCMVRNWYSCMRCVLAAAGQHRLCCCPAA